MLGLLEALIFNIQITIETCVFIYIYFFVMYIYIYKFNTLPNWINKYSLEMATGIWDI